MKRYRFAGAYAVQFSSMAWQLYTRNGVLNAKLTPTCRVSYNVTHAGAMITKLAIEDILLQEVRA